MWDGTAREHYAVVAGGRDGDQYQSSGEILQLLNTLPNWKNGPSLPERLAQGAMVQEQRGSLLAIGKVSST